MNKSSEFLSSGRNVISVSADDRLEGTDDKTFVTSDHEAIRQWASKRHAEPATGEQTGSGPATVDVHDGGTGIRFNFPGAGRFRPIAWSEWFDNFDRYGLVFVYEEHMLEGNISNRYRIVKSDEIDRHIQSWSTSLTTTRQQRAETESARQTDNTCNALPTQDWRRMTDVAHDHIARRAYELYQRRGTESGHELDDWLQAEHDVQQHQSAE